MKLHNSQTRSLPTRFDPFLDDAALRRGYQLLLAAAWDDFLLPLDRDPASWLLTSILTCDDAAVETVVFRRLHEARPSARTLALLGGALVRDAELLLLGLRTDPRRPHRVIDLPPSVDHNEAEALLIDAETTLQEAVRMRPGLVDPWVHLLSSGRLLGLDLPELRTRFENAHSRVPFRPDACRQYLLGLSARGGGSDDAMFEFARWVAAEAPPESAAQVVLPMAHLEHGLGPMAHSLTEHLANPETVLQLTPALARFLETTDPHAGPMELGPLNAFALAMTIDDDLPARLVTETFRRIDNRPTSYPWSLYEDEPIAEVFTEVQRTQLRSAGRYL